MGGWGDAGFTDLKRYPGICNGNTSVAWRCSCLMRNLDLLWQLRFADKISSQRLGSWKGGVLSEPGYHWLFFPLLATAGYHDIPSFPSILVYFIINPSSHQNILNVFPDPKCQKSNSHSSQSNLSQTVTTSQQRLSTTKSRQPLAIRFSKEEHLLLLHPTPTRMEMQSRRIPSWIPMLQPIGPQRTMRRDMNVDMNSIRLSPGPSKKKRNWFVGWTGMFAYGQ